MSPEQARGQLTDARTDLFSLGTVLYQMATGVLPFQGETSAVVFDAILNREPQPVSQVNPALPGELGRILGRALEKDRNLRYQTATDLKTELMRLKRDSDSGGRRAAEDSRPGKAAEKSIAVLYFENLSGVKEDEYLRDGVTEDIISELSKIKTLRTFSRTSVLAFRDKPVTPTQVGQQLGAAYLLTGSLRRGGTRLRINAELVDTKNSFPLWSERYDREMADVFAVQDEIAHKIAEALRITLTPQEQEALARKPTENPQAYDLFLRGKSFARRVTRQDTEFALQMFENAVALDPQLRGRPRRDRLHLRPVPLALRARAELDRARQGGEPARERARQGRAGDPGRRGLDPVRGRRTTARPRRGCAGDRAQAGHRRRLLPAGPLAVRGRQYQEVLDIAEAAIAVAGGDYNVYVPIQNALGVLGKTEAMRQHSRPADPGVEAHLKEVPEDARGRTILATDYVQLHRKTTRCARQPGDGAPAQRRHGHVQRGLRVRDAEPQAGVPGRRSEGVERRLQGPGLGPSRPRPRDPHGDPEFEQLYPETPPGA